MGEGITILKFKRDRSCYVVPLCLDDKRNKTVDHFTHQLVTAINSAGGLDFGKVSSEVTQLTPEDVQLALPKTKENPYSNQWVPIDDSVLQSVVFNDHDTVVFKHTDDTDFHLQQIEYQE